MNPQIEEIKAKLQPLLKRSYEAMELLAPMQIRLDLDRAYKSVRYHGVSQEQLGNFDAMCQVRREPQNLESSTEVNIPDLFSGQSKLTCLSKYKWCKQEGNEIQPKLAICICVYNEEKRMLIESLDNIYNNLEAFKTVAGIDSEQIVVTVIFDGIESVSRGDFDEDMITLFDEHDYRNWPKSRQEQKSLLEVLQKDPHNLDSINWNSISINRSEEIAERTNNRFRTRYDEYMGFKRLQRICWNLDHPTDINRVPVEVKTEYLKLKNATVRSQLDHATQKAMQRYRESLRLNQQRGQVNSVTTFEQTSIKYDEKQKKRELEENFEIYANHKKYMEEAYSNVLELTQRYLEARRDTTLIYPMRYVPKLIEDQALQAERRGHSSSKPTALNVLLCVNHRNAGKLRSQALFFLGFCEFMRPELCLLLDIGLKPLGNSILEMYKYMDCNWRTGVVCGYIGLRIERSGDKFGNSETDRVDPLSNLLHRKIFSVQRAQMFEYHLEHLINKPFEAAFNYIHALPGAFSCYRYQTLRGDLLLQYLGPVFEYRELSLEELNRYLTDDRNLSLGLKAKGYDFAYIPTAKAIVDPAGDLSILLAQRKRWINGSWFSFFYTISERYYIRSCAASLQLYYYVLAQGVSYVSIGLFSTALYVSMDTVLSQYITQPLGGLSVDSQRNGILAAVMFIYLLSIGSIFFLSLQVRSSDKKFKPIYYAVSALLGLYGCLVVGLMFVNLASLAHTEKDCKLTSNLVYNLGLPDGSRIPQVIGVMMAANFAIYILHVLFSFSSRIIWQMLVSTPSYLFYALTYLHVLVIYAFCRIDDVNSWGLRTFTRNQNKLKKFKHVGKFLLWNCLAAITFTIMAANNKASPQGINGRSFFLLLLSGILLFSTIFKFVVSICYFIRFYICNCRSRYTEEERSRNESRSVLINQQISRQMNSLKERYVRQMTDLLRRKDTSTVSKLRMSRMSMNRK